MIRVVIPFHLRTLSGVQGEVKLDLDGRPVTIGGVLDALETRYPMLRGTIRDHATLQRRPFLRYFACQQDLSLTSPDAPLPEAVAGGSEPFIVLGSIAGG
ncbi:MAG TPA: MoaD/ThiS family protein [Phycisphaerales bacterium]|nr:MoaD/ThiS family protein [Phycisphaerales bacterium]